MPSSHFGIGIYHPKREVNIGTLFRSAHAFGASWCFTVGRRYKPQGSDTTKSWRSLPLFHFDTCEQMVDMLPLEAILIGVELAPSATSLKGLAHPRQAVYILGAEDGGLPEAVQKRCARVVQIPGARFCLNVAVAGSIVMYHRAAQWEESNWL
jgi:tRNA G18 (ribose-2'-O)-methylase SpoU